MNIEDAKVGMPVRYVPAHVHGDSTHQDCEDGKVSSVNDQWVFVQFKAQWLYDGPGQGCNPDDLVPLSVTPT